MLSLMFSLKVQPGQPPQVFLAHGLVHHSPPPDLLPGVVGGVCPPVSLHLDISQDHFFCGPEGFDLLQGVLGVVRDLQKDFKEDAGSSILVDRASAPANTLLEGRSHRLYKTQGHLLDFIELSCEQHGCHPLTTLACFC